MGDFMQEVELGANESRAMGVKGVGSNGLMGARTPITELLLRLGVAVLTVISVSLIASDLGFSTVPAFNYLLGATVLSFLYCLFESVMVGYHMASSGRTLLPIAFYTYFTVAADLVCSILLLSGSSAAFGVTTQATNGGNFFAQANGSASLAFVAFLLMLPLVALSSRRFSVLAS